MPNIDLSILNQRQTPAFYADVFANRPAAGFVGRIFVSTDTYAFYRDNGTSWDLIGGPGTGTVTGTGANGQVTFWNGASTITGSNDLFWDATNGHLGVNTNVPGTALDVHHDQPTVAILNQTVATNDVRIGFQNNGVGLWRIGAFYNAGANDFGIYDAVAALQPVTVKKTTGQVLIGTSTVGSGKLVVASNIGDNGIQIVGASAPSLRIDSAESGPTKRAGLGISTATNNFIQGSADRDFCIFNGSTAAASPILFGIYDAGAANVQEAARISPARNFLLGTTTDAGFKLDVYGQARIYQPSTNSANYLNIYNNRSRNAAVLTETTNGGFYAGTSIGTDTFCYQIYDGNAGLSRITINSAGNLGLGIIPNTWTGTNVKAFQFGNTGALGNSGTFGTILFNNSYYDGGYKYISSNPASAYVQDGNTHLWYNAPSGTAGNAISFTQAMTLSGSTGNLLIGTTTDAGQKLQVSGNAYLSGYLGINRTPSFAIDNNYDNAALVRSAESTFIIRSFDKATSNLTATIATVTSLFANTRVMLKITLIVVSAVNDAGSTQTGYALWTPGTKSVSTFNLDVDFGGTSVATLSWSGNSLQVTTTSSYNYERYTYIIEGSQRDGAVIS